MIKDWNKNIVNRITNILFICYRNLVADNLFHAAFEQVRYKFYNFGINSNHINVMKLYNLSF